MLETRFGVIYFWIDLTWLQSKCTLWQSQPPICRRSSAELCWVFCPDVQQFCFCRERPCNSGFLPCTKQVNISQFCFLCPVSIRFKGPSEEMTVPESSTGRAQTAETDRVHGKTMLNIHARTELSLRLPLLTLGRKQKSLKWKSLSVGKIQIQFSQLSCIICTTDVNLFGSLWATWRPRNSLRVAHA